MEELSPLTVSVVGSWAVPGWYAQFCSDVARYPDRFGEDDRSEAVTDAIRLAIDDQERSGAEVITDGEMQRVEFNPTFFDLMVGLERLPQPRRLGTPGYDQSPRYQCLAPISAPKGLGLVDAYRRLAGMTTSVVKVTVPGPMTLAGSLAGGKVYRDRDAIAEAILPIVNREMRALADAGATIVQLDEPAFSLRPNDPELFLRLLQRVVAGVRAFVSLHLCFGNANGRAFGQRLYRPMLAELAKAPIQQLALEFASREMAELDLLREIKAPMGVAIGLVDVKNHWVEPVELIADRMRSALKFIEPQRVHVVPDCGFAHTPRATACQKLKNLSQAAAAVRGEMGL